MLAQKDIENLSFCSLIRNFAAQTSKPMETKENEIPKKQQEQTYRCNDCGNVIYKHEVFCSKCGKLLDRYDFE
jgi:uncharacterized OB-fold protein